MAKYKTRRRKNYDRTEPPRDYMKYWRVVKYWTRNKYEVGIRIDLSRYSLEIGLSSGETIRTMKRHYMNCRSKVNVWCQMSMTNSMVKSSQKMHLCLKQTLDIMIEPTGNIL